MRGETMTKGERFLAALRNEVPDRVPVAPDFSNYIPVRRTGLPFWAVYFEGEVPLWRAYLETADHFGTEAWMASCTGAPIRFEEADVETKTETRYDEVRDGMVRRTVFRTPDGELSCEETCLRADPPSPTEKLMKDIAADWPKYVHLQTMPREIDRDAWETMREACAERGQAFGVTVGYPGFQAWQCAVEGGIAPLTYAEMDAPELLERWLELDLERGTRIMELLLAARPDYILFGGSGTITMASPDLARKYALPALARWSRMAAEAGVPTHLHSCGKSRVLVDILVEGTDIGSINPLEEPPMGDVDLAEVKRVHGDRIGFMGNLHTTRVMLKGSPALVREESLQALRAAGAGGGFILSTGDQCGPDTPEENLFAMLETACTYGVYDRATGTLPDLPPAG